METNISEYCLSKEPMKLGERDKGRYEIKGNSTQTLRPKGLKNL